VNETYVRDRIRDMLKGHGYEVRTVTDAIVCPNCTHTIVPSRGLPDLSILHPLTGRGYQIEVKVVRRNETSFPFSRIGDQQRERLEKYQACAFLGLGEIGPTKTGNGSRLLNVWLVPWSAWLAIERAVTADGRKSIRREDLRTLAAEFSTKGATGWSLFPSHTIHPGEELS
jgi:hypothetical protein